MFQLLRIAFRNSRMAKINSGVVLVLEIISILLLYKLNGVYGHLYQAIQNYQIPAIWGSIEMFSGIAMLLVIVNGYLGYFINKLSFNIREGLTFHALPRLATYSLPSPQLEQRVQEDIRKFGESGVDMITAVLRAGIKLPLFLGIILSLTDYKVGGIVVLSVVLGTLLTKFVGAKLIPLQSEQEGNEAVFRAIPDTTNFFTIQSTFIRINDAIKLLSFTQSGIGQVFALLPFILLMPMYISHALTLGAFMQSTRALSTIIDSLGVIIDNRQLLINVQTCLLRLKFMQVE